MRYMQFGHGELVRWLLLSAEDILIDFGFRDFVWERCGTGCRRDVAVVSTENGNFSTLRGIGALGTLASKRAAPATVGLCQLRHFPHQLCGHS